MDESQLPLKTPQPDFSQLIEFVEEGLSNAIKQDYMDDDFEHYIAELVFTTIYGAKFFDWYNRQKFLK